MNADKEELSRYREALVSHLAVTAGGACPHPERIWEAAWGELQPREVAELADHTLACPDCSLAWQLAVELGRGRAVDQPLRLQRPSPMFRHRIWGGVLAAAAAVVLVVTVPWQDLEDRPAPGTRGGQESRGIVALISPEQPLPRQQCLVRWTSPWADATYSVAVRDEDFEILAEDSDLERAEFLVPAEALADVAPGALLYLTVRATGPDGMLLDEASFPLPLE